MTKPEPNFGQDAKGMALMALRHRVYPVSDKTSWIVVEAELADGATGFGEATLGGQEVLIAALSDRLAAQIAQTRPQGVLPALALLDALPDSPARRVLGSALEQALFDALARRAGLSLSAMLGGPTQGRARAYANINRGLSNRAPGGFGAAARQAVAGDAYRAVKIAPFDGFHHRTSPDPAAFARGVQRIAAVRKAVGPGIDLLVDCHRRLDPLHAHRLLRETADLAPFWIEDALDQSAHGGAEARDLRRAAHRLGIRLAGGEHLRTPDGAARLIAEGGHDVLLPDLRLTGVAGGMAILRLATASGLAASLHNPAGPVLDAISRHVALAVPGFALLERQVGESPLYDRIGTGVPVAAGGTVSAAGPGSGWQPALDGIGGGHGGA